MHRAYRSFRKRASRRNVSSVASRPLGKWERPQPASTSDSAPSSSPSDWLRAHVSSSSTSSVPQSRSWARPQPSSWRTPTASGSDSGRWAPSSDRHSTPSLPSNRSTDSNSMKNSPASDFGMQRDPAPHQVPIMSRNLAPPTVRAGNSPRQDKRDAAPHRTQPLLDTTAQGNNRRSSISDILRKDRIKFEIETQLDSPEVEQDQVEEPKSIKSGDSSTPSLVSEDKTEALRDEEVFTKVRTRGGKQVRGNFKERGSILSKIKGNDDVAIGDHSRARLGNVIKDKEKRKKAAKTIKPVNLDLFIPSVVSVGNLAKLLKVRLDNLRRTMIRVGMNAEASYDHLLTSEYASLLAMEYNRNPIVNDEAAFDIYAPCLLRSAPVDPLALPSRPPVVTIMGHVDHGKTTLLDTLRSTSIAKGEAGGITQHIGAFSVLVPVNGTQSGDIRTITFLDTPGHAAFSAMRARGAGVTDIVVLVVAADDGIMPQTREVIELIKKETVGVVVAINKMDKPGVDVSKVEQALLAEGVQLETFSGDVPSVPVSGLTGQGLDQLVETISALAEMQDLRAERDGKMQGFVLESRIQKGLGPVATVLLLRGCLKPSDYIIAGVSHAKVRILSDSTGKTVRAAYPGMAVTVSGWKELPSAGDEVLQGTETEVKKALANRIRKAELDATLSDMEAINEQRRLEREQKEKEVKMDSEGAEITVYDGQTEGPKQLRLVIKADVSGSVEAVAGALQGIGNNVACVKIVATGVGDVTESDIMRAKAVGGTVVAFAVNVPRPVQAEAASQQVPVITSTIIYRLMDAVKSLVIALLPPIIEKRVTGEANVLQLFDIHLKGKKIKKVAGCRVTNGLVEKSRLARVVREGEVIHEGRLETLRHLKRDIMEASKGTECGMAFESFDDLHPGDMIQMYQQIEKPGNL
ncbi:hypothetical protein AcW2_004584 [Taiwanofungus camphoratus]|nr:hypothetical protein AcW2_004584 [Antrodia cinnamomea]